MRTIVFSTADGRAVFSRYDAWFGLTPVTELEIFNAVLYDLDARRQRAGMSPVGDLWVFES